MHPILGHVELEYWQFTVNGWPDLTLVVYTAVDRDVAERMRVLVGEKRVTG